jgi:hypothetical protein
VRTSSCLVSFHRSGCRLCNQNSAALVLLGRRADPLTLDDEDFLAVLSGAIFWESFTRSFAPFHDHW